MTRVLAVEDSPTQAEALRMILEDAGFLVRVVTNGFEAMAELQEAAFDVVVSDVVMPKMDGYELCRFVKRSPAMAGVPVILLTSLTDPLDVVNGLEAGADNFIRKPYQPAQLVARIEAALKNRELRGDDDQDAGIRLAFLEREFEINAGRSQMLDLLVSTFEELVVVSRQVRAREADLTNAHVRLQKHLTAVDLERTRLQTVVDAVPVPLFVLVADGTVSHISRAAGRTFDTSAEEVQGRHLEDVVSFVDVDGAKFQSDRLPHHRARTTGRPASAGAAFDVFLSRPDGERLPVVLEASPVLDGVGRPLGSVGTAHVLGALTHHDSVTGLPNSVAYLERAASLLADPRSDAALLLIALDRFEVTRAALGHQATNELLAEVSRRLRIVFEPERGGCARTECFLAYLGGSQFGVLLGGLPSSFELLQFADAARRMVADVNPRREGLRTTASMGVALAEGNLKSSELFAAANAALRRASQAGGDQVELFGSDDSKDALDRLAVEVDLRDAVEHEQVELYYQPEVDLATGQLVGFEALARWRHPARGPIGPDVFIVMAEESGLILRLGRQLLRRACAEASSWPNRPDGSKLSVAVNVSALQLRPDFVAEVLSALDEAGLDASRLVLELTESATMTESDVTLPLLEELRGHGVRISLDDFGTGYSSMSMLAQVHLDQLKLDRGFVARLQEGGRDEVVTRSIVALADALGIPVLAEGVETVGQAALVRRLGCAQAQGYHFGRPISPAALVDFLTQTWTGD